MLCIEWGSFKSRNFKKYFVYLKLLGKDFKEKKNFRDIVVIYFYLFFYFGIVIFDIRRKFNDIRYSKEYEVM